MRTSVSRAYFFFGLSLLGIAYTLALFTMAIVSPGSINRPSLIVLTLVAFVVSTNFATIRFESVQVAKLNKKFVKAGLRGGPDE